MTTAIITDSTASVSREISGRPDLRIVPLTFHFGPEESYKDKVDMTDVEFYERLKRGDVFPTTSQPSAGAFVEAYEALDAYDDLLVLTISRELSGTYESAVAAAGMVDRPVEVVDTQSAEMGSGLILRQALRALDEGGDFRDVRRAAEVAIRNCRIFFAVGTLEYLHRSGRIGRAQKLVGTALNIRPVLKMEDGMVTPHKRVRGAKRQMAAIVEEVRPAVEEGKVPYFGHVAAPEMLDDLYGKLGISEPLVAEIGGVVGAHVGPGTYGVAYL